MHNNITRCDLDAVIKFLQQDDPRLTNGPRVAEFEKTWSKWLGVDYSIFVSSGAAANFVTIQALKHLYPEGGEIIVPAFTWISDISSVILLGFEPVFVDIKMETLGMDEAMVLDVITDKTRAVFLTHAQGFNGLSDKLLFELERRGIALIEDVCESHGAMHRGVKVGSFGLISNFSFFYAHHMSTIEGGMICTNDSDLYQLMRMLRSHGMVRESSDEVLKQSFSNEFPDLNPSFIFAEPALNFRNTEIGAVIGLSQIKRLDENNEVRRRNLELFLKLLDDEIFFTKFNQDGSCNYAFQVILNASHCGLVEKLQILMANNGIEYRKGSVGGGNQLRQPYLKEKWGDAAKDYRTTDYIHHYGFYLGNYPHLSEERIKKLVTILNSVAND